MREGSVIEFNKEGLKEDQLHSNVQGRNEDKSDGEDVIQVEILRSEAELQEVNEDDLQAPQEHGPIGVGGLVEADEREGPEGPEEGRERQEADVGWVGREDVVVESPGRIQACKNEAVFIYMYMLGEKKLNLKRVCHGHHLHDHHIMLTVPAPNNSGHFSRRMFTLAYTYVRTINAGGTAANGHPQSDDRQVDVLADEHEDVEEGEEDGHGQVREDHADVEVRFGGGGGGGGIAEAEDVERPRECRVEDEIRFRRRSLRCQME